MIVEFNDPSVILPRPDVVVLGAGAVGLVMSVKLARQGVKVLLCESGGRSAETGSQALNDSVVIGRPHAGISEGRARVLGGTTTLWGGQLISFREIDFQPRSWLGLKGWPINRDVLSPYYEEVAKMLGLPVLEDDDAAIWSALKLRSPDFGPELEVILTRWLKEPNLARVFARELAGNPNLTVALHATGTGFDSYSDHATIKSVTLCAPSGRSVDVEANHFVVACGTIEANRLMLAAAQARPDLPWANNKWVGCAFQDHLDIRVADVTLLDKKAFGNIFDNIFLNGYKYNPKVVLARSVQEEIGTTNIAGTFVFESSLSAHLANFKIFAKALRNGAMPPNLRSMPSHFAALMKIWLPLVTRYLKDNRALNPADLGIGLRLHCEQRPLATSRIRLDSSRVDINHMPLVVLDWRIDGSEIEAMAALCARIGGALERNGLATLRVDPRILAKDTRILDEARDTNHHCGGLQMSRTEEEGVVDSDLKVHGVANLFIAGAAVYPSSSFANPTFTAMALGLRLASKITGTTAQSPELAQ
ncbi:GMC oxidoreductase [Sphingomonas sp. NFR15]|uniref:GMC oxidoreductase n=1 Tax=Sphingomonas sp. NFR15 TaxID=1566282 RepID=UPI0008821DB3|nr:GMC family oxidoreductase [Sphingomonas sp. NFR15]SDA36959.1 Choline dehydrogenase [Sphingomonas sp. NFR15]